MAAAPLSISFIVPCYNEEANVAATVAEIRAAMERKPGDVEIVLIDDRSSDRTGDIMEVLAAEDRRIRVVRNPANLGYGGAYKRGVATATMDHVVLIPGDNGFPAASIAEVLRHVGEADIIVPCVSNAARTPFRTVISSAYTRLVNWLFQLDVGYYNGAVVYRRALLQTIEITSDGFGYQAEALVKLLARGCSYVECSVPIRERMAGASSALKPRNLISVFRTLGHLLWNVGLFRRYPLAGASARPKPGRRRS